MEFHLPGHIRTLKDFLVHLAIVTLGILIALGLEQLVESHHRTKVAREAVAAFRRELRDNRTAVVAMMTAMPQLREQIKQQIVLLSAPATDSKQPIHLRYADIHFELVSTASWDTAIATQALNDIPPEEAKRYSAAYGVFNVFLEEERSGLRSWQELLRFGTDASLLSAEQRTRAIEQLNVYAGFTYVVELIGGGTLRTCDEALQ